MNWQGEGKRRTSFYYLSDLSYLGDLGDLRKDGFMKKAISTDKAPKAIGPYSQAVEIGGLVFCSGQLAIDPKTNAFEDKTTEVQAKMVLTNLQAVVKEAGSSMDQVVKTTIYLTDMADFPKVNEVYGSFFKEPYPARATVQVAALPKGAKVEIEAIAYRVHKGCDCENCGEEGCC